MNAHIKVRPLLAPSALHAAGKGTFLPGALGCFLEHVPSLARVLVPAAGPQADRKIALKRLSAGGQSLKRYFWIIALKQPELDAGRGDGTKMEHRT